jgi:toxin ParE1/3/4
MLVRFTHRAARQLDKILADLKEVSPGAAKAFRQRVEQVCERIGKFPIGFQEVGNRKGVRRVPMVRFPYLIFYTINGDEVVVLRIRHGARGDLLDNL